MTAPVHRLALLDPPTDPPAPTPAMVHLGAPVELDATCRTCKGSHLPLWRFRDRSRCANCSVKAILTAFPGVAAVAFHPASGSRS